MSDLSDLAKVLYDDLFKRDLLGKIGPGSLALLALALAMEVPKLLTSLPNGLQWLVVVASVALAFVMGVALQVVGELLGLHSASPRPSRLLLFKTGGSWQRANSAFEWRLSLIRNATADQWRSGSQMQRERFVVLKEASGNMGLALLVVVGCLLARDSMEHLAVLVSVAALAFFLVVSHYRHARRQENFEINVLEQSGLVSAGDAHKMRKRSWDLPPQPPAPCTSK